MIVGPAFERLYDFVAFHWKFVIEVIVVEVELVHLVLQLGQSFLEIFNFFLFLL